MSTSANNVVEKRSSEKFQTTFFCFISTFSLIHHRARKLNTHNGKTTESREIQRDNTRRRTNSKYSGLTLNQYGVASPCRTICTVYGFVALS